MLKDPQPSARIVEAVAPTSRFLNRDHALRGIDDVHPFEHRPRRRDADETQQEGTEAAAKVSSDDALVMMTASLLRYAVRDPVFRQIVERPIRRRRRAESTSTLLDLELALLQLEDGLLVIGEDFALADAVCLTT